MLIYMLMYMFNMVINKENFEIIYNIVSCVCEDPSTGISSEINVPTKANIVKVSTISPIPTINMSAIPTINLSAIPTINASAIPTINLSAIPTANIPAIPTANIAPIPTINMSDIPSSSESAQINITTPQITKTILVCKPIE